MKKGGGTGNGSANICAERWVVRKLANITQVSAHLSEGLQQTDLEMVVLSIMVL